MVGSSQTECTERSRSEAGRILGEEPSLSSRFLYLDVGLPILYINAIAIYICRPTCFGSTVTEAIPSLIKNQPALLAYLP
jgi:hypothetical protein